MHPRVNTYCCQNLNALFIRKSVLSHQRHSYLEYFCEILKENGEKGRWGNMSILIGKSPILHVEEKIFNSEFYYRSTYSFVKPLTPSIHV